MDKSLDLPKTKTFILDSSVVPTIRRTPADPVEAYFQLSKQMNHMDELSQKAESLLHYYPPLFEKNSIVLSI
jgi:hypothetical protein